MITGKTINELPQLTGVNYTEVTIPVQYNDVTYKYNLPEIIFTGSTSSGMSYNNLLILNDISGRVEFSYTEYQTVFIKNPIAQYDILVTNIDVNDNTIKKLTIYAFTGEDTYTPDDIYINDESDSFEWFSNTLNNSFNNQNTYKFYELTIIENNIFLNETFY
jgi:hypothetical protein